MAQDCQVVVGTGNLGSLLLSGQFFALLWCWGVPELDPPFVLEWELV